jgi:hypothetical protein
VYLLSELKWMEAEEMLDGTFGLEDGSKSGQIFVITLHRYGATSKRGLFNLSHILIWHS